MSEERNVTEMSLSEARLHFSNVMNRAAYGEERIVVTSHGSPKAAIVPLEDLRRLMETEYLLEPESAPAASPA